jgi:hypothetical protein
MQPRGSPDAGCRVKPQKVMATRRLLRTTSGNAVDGAHAIEIVAKQFARCRAR